MGTEVLILVVEDDLVDIMTIKRAFKDIKITNPIIICHNGLEALEYLKKPLNKRPGLILLDINMPKMNGIEFLEVIKKDKEFKSIPVVVLTTSKAEQDKMESFNLGIAGYMIKPVDYLQFVETVKTIHLYWTLSELPDKK
ncbi:MAG: two-component system response regulator [Flavobacteriaceae bacterium]|nr:MAG: two-component system response regulator [Flavobacteriaceae bacterium]